MITPLGQLSPDIPFGAFLPRLEVEWASPEGRGHAAGGVCMGLPGVLAAPPTAGGGQGRRHGIIRWDQAAGAPCF